MRSKKIKGSIRSIFSTLPSFFHPDWLLATPPSYTLTHTHIISASYRSKWVFCMFFFLDWMSEWVREREIFIIFFFKPTIKFIFPSHTKRMKNAFLFNQQTTTPVQLSPHHIFSHVTFYNSRDGIYTVRRGSERERVAVWRRIMKLEALKWVKLKSTENIYLVEKSYSHTRDELMSRALYVVDGEASESQQEIDFN